LVFECIDPANVTAGSIHDSELHEWIRITGLWISRDLEVLVIGNVIDYRELRHRRLVKTQVRNAGRIRTPPVRAEVASAIKFFLIYPIKAPIENLRAAITRERTFATLHTEIFDVEIVLTYEADHLAVGTKSLANLFFRIAGETNRAVATKLVIEKIVGPVDQG